jgi:L-fuconolactonase
VILDSHHHLWDTRELEYALFETVDELRRPFLSADYELLGPPRSICVEAASAGADGRRETEWLLRETAESAVVAGLVAWAPLERDDLVRHLDWLAEQPGKPIVGVRRSFEFEDPEFPRRAAAGAREAGARGLVVDLVLFPRSLRATIDLVDTCPGTRFVLDHLAKPPIREGGWEPWASELAELALRDNVVCKLSGLPTEADRDGWTVDDLRPYVEHALANFGPDRLLYGSDWPVVNLAGGAAQWLAAVRTLLAHLDASERNVVLSGNATRVYGLGSS